MNIVMDKGWHTDEAGEVFEKEAPLVLEECDPDEEKKKCR